MVSMDVEAPSLTGNHAYDLALGGLAISSLWSASLLVTPLGNRAVIERYVIERYLREPRVLPFFICNIFLDIPRAVGWAFS